MDRPYNDGGVEHSGRVAKPGDKGYYDVKKQKSATKIIEGKVNTRQVGEATTWSVVIAMAHSDILAHVESGKLPCNGSMWRINFSRVEKRGDINWTWQVQIAWNAEAYRFGGNVNMDLSDAWSYLVFGDVSETTSSSCRDSSWPARLAVMNVYYAQHEYYAQHGSFASKMNQPAKFVNQAIVSSFQIDCNGASDGSPAFMVVVKGNLDGRMVIVTDDRLIQVHPSEKVLWTHSGSGL